MDLLEEIKAEAKDEQLLLFIQRYGVRFMLALGAALMVFAGYLYWQQYQQELRNKEGQQFWQAAYEASKLAPNDENVSAAFLQSIAKEFKPIAAGEAYPYKGMALLMLANAAEMSEDYTQAVTLFDQASAELGSNDLGVLAALKAATLVVAHNLQVGQPSEARIVELSKNARSPWYPQVMLLKASWGYQQGHSTEALEALQIVRKNTALLSGESAETLAALETYLAGLGNKDADSAQIGLTK